MITIMESKTLIILNGWYWIILDAEWTVLVGCHVSKVHSHQIENLSTFLKVLGGVERWGCWAVVPPAGSSVQPPRAVWTEELQWTELVPSGRSSSANPPTNQPTRVKKGEVQDRGIGRVKRGKRRKGNLSKSREFKTGGRGWHNLAGEL